MEGIHGEVALPLAPAVLAASTGWRLTRSFMSRTAPERDLKVVLLPTRTPSRRHTLTPPHTHTRTPSHPHTLIHAHPHTLTPSHPHTLTPSHPHTLTPSHPHTLTPSRPHTLAAGRVAVHEHGGRGAGRGACILQSLDHVGRAVVVQSVPGVSHRCLSAAGRI